MGKVGWLDRILRAISLSFGNDVIISGGNIDRLISILVPSKIDPKISLPKIRRIINKENRREIFLDLTRDLLRNSDRIANLTRPIYPLSEFVTL